MYNLNLLALCLVLISSHSAATTGEGELMGLFGGIITALSTEEEAAEIQNQMGQMTELLGGIGGNGLRLSGAKDPSAADHEAPLAVQEQASGCFCNGNVRDDGAGECQTTYEGRKFCYVDAGSCSDQRESSTTGWFWSYQACQSGQSDPTTMLDNIPYLSQDPTISSVAHTNVTTSNSADDNPEYVKVSSAFQEHSMGIYKLQELRVNGFPVWKKIGHKLDTYLFVPTCSEVESENIAGCGRWTIGYGPELESIFSDYRRAQLNLRAHGIGPEIEYKVAWLYLPQTQPVPKSPVNSQGWLYVAKKKCTLFIFECINWKVDWKRDNTIKVEAFTGGYEINSTGEAAEHYPALMGRYLLTRTPDFSNDGKNSNIYHAQDFPVYEIENKGLYIYVDIYGYWAVGEDWKSLDHWMYQDNGNDPTPDFPSSEGWVFWNGDDEEWQLDPTIKLQFVIDL